MRKLGTENQVIYGYKTVTEYLQNEDYQGFMKTQGITNPVSQGLTKRLYSIKEASLYLGRSVWAVREMLWAGKIPYVKDGRRILLDIQDMDSWIEKNKTQFTY
ncbi:MAG: helix-turn-helix domain-containing protein [Nitrospirota bacterium]